jgi:hypothetical protein
MLDPQCGGGAHPGRLILPSVFQSPAIIRDLPIKSLTELLNLVTMQVVCVANCMRYSVLGT